MDVESRKHVAGGTVKCCHHYICQSAGGRPHCRIADSINDSVFFTKTRHPLGCRHQHPFGSTFICCCSIRHELYRRLKI